MNQTNGITYPKKGPADVTGSFRSGVVRRPGEAPESLLKRFKKTVQAEGIMGELRKREHYVAPSLKARLKHQAAVRAQRRKMKKAQAKQF